MRMAVYRNIDKPFKIFGLNIVQVTLLCFLFVIGSEIVELFSVHRIWILALTLFVGVSLIQISQVFGELFVGRLRRFAGLPAVISSKRFSI